MKTYSFRGLLQRNGWLRDPVISIDEKGNISNIEESGSKKADHSIDGYALPGFQNAHSHAFQYAMAGLAEIHRSGNISDDFWSWREAMYRLALCLDPDQMEAVATMLYSEMIRHGYTNVAEFHYLHHDKNGRPYGNLAEMGSRLVAAAKTAGIGITLIPIFYQKGGFGKPPTERQKRFISADIDNYLKLFEASAEACGAYEGANIGLGIHSMRGVEPKVIAEIPRIAPRDVPFHIHVSEQLREVEESVAYLGKRPVEWLLQNIELNDQFHLVHATHLTKEEISGIARSNANVVLCPSTEGNLGDGIFSYAGFQEAGGKWSIGTDSHIGLNPFEELRLLDYGQRLTSHRRNIFTSEATGDAGHSAIEMATFTGRMAMNDYSHDFFAVGESFNAAILDAKTPLLANSSFDNLCATAVYASDVSHILGTIINGQILARKGQHINQDEILDSFTQTMSKLKIR